LLGCRLQLLLWLLLLKPLQLLLGCRAKHLQPQPSSSRLAAAAAAVGVAAAADHVVQA